MSRIWFRGAVGGERYELPGASNPPDFTFNGCVFTAEELVGQYLIALEATDVGFAVKWTDKVVQEPTLSPAGFALSTQNKVEKMPVLSSAPIAGYLASNGEQRRFGNLVAMADLDGSVQVLFGHTPIAEGFECKDLADLTDVSTPPSEDDRMCEF